MSSQNRAVAGITIALVVTAIHFSGLLQAGDKALKQTHDPSVPPASAALANTKATEGNVQDLTY